MRCIVIPALIGFAVFLVLMSVKVTTDLNLTTENATNTTRNAKELKEIEVTAKSMHLVKTTTKNSEYLESR